MPQQGNPPGSGNKQGDTPLVDRNKLLLNWKRPVAKRNKVNKKWVRELDESGNPVIVQASGNTLLYLPQKVFDWFGIATYDGPEPGSNAQSTVSVVSAHTRLIYNGIDDTTGRQIQVGEFERAAGQGGKGLKPISIAIPTGLSHSRSKKARRIIIPFPPFYTVWMVNQALATMLTGAGPNGTGDRPAKFWVVETETSYTINYAYDESDDLVAGAKYGAWQSDDLITEANVSQGGDAVTNTAATSSSGDTSGPTPAPSPTP